MQTLTRSSGILLHPTSLPGPHGIGDLGSAAFKFLNFLSNSGQTWWQMLPINPPGYSESPYNALSAFAGNPLLISLEPFKEGGLLSSEDLEPLQSPSPTRINFQVVKSFKERAFRKAFSAFMRRHNIKEFKNFCDYHRDWLDDFALFQAIKENQSGQSWVDWPRDLRQRKKEALKKTSRLLEEEISYHKFLQFEFAIQWKTLKQAAEEKGIHLMGDIPIFIAHDSADVWSHPELFKLRQDGRSSVVAGVPPDYFSPTGQLWGNPLYRWNIHRKNNYSWWINRLETTLQRFHAVRLDHFIGFYRAWEIPAYQKTAENGKWVRGPGGTFFKEVLKKLDTSTHGSSIIVAEDLGNIIPPIHKLRKRFHFPGMIVLHFSFGDGIEAVKKRWAEMDRHMVVYTGTHDNNTSKGWYQETNPQESSRQTALEILGSDGTDIHWALIKLALSLKADLAIVPLQDVLGLGSESRMNQPGTTHGNWEWRFQENELTESISRRLYELSKENGRIH